MGTSSGAYTGTRTSTHILLSR